MKLEEGMYCYDKCNRKLGIGKILTKPSKNNNVGIIYKHGHAPVVSVGNVVASHNIIDLIEVGDFISYIYPSGLGILGFEDVKVTEGLLNILQNGENNHEYTIKTIVTKQQMESMQYEVK